ncbi:MAG: lipopolysaccharide assembly protein LapA domain-containing protein [Immundisolibacter sp.]|uniref:lipopolysaccharide assembly protein LapA domain-containing protein n=1 Tax=Immundisolibacter sp. TaxID=1934948 RepID=UPI003EE1D8C3
MMRVLRLLLLLTVALLAGLFASVNMEPVKIEYLLGNGELPLSWLLLLVVAVGILLGWLAALPLRWRRGRELRQLRSEQRRLQTQLSTPPDP